jgi:hypothetical protein
LDAGHLAVRVVRCARLPSVGSGVRMGVSGISPGRSERAGRPMSYQGIYESGQGERGEFGSRSDVGLGRSGFVRGGPAQLLSAEGKATDGSLTIGGFASSAGPPSPPGSWLAAAA